MASVCTHSKANYKTLFGPWFQVHIGCMCMHLQAYIQECARIPICLSCVKMLYESANVPFTSLSHPQSSMTPWTWCSKKNSSRTDATLGDPKICSIIGNSTLGVSMSNLKEQKSSGLHSSRIRFTGFSWEFGSAVIGMPS